VTSTFEDIRSTIRGAVITEGDPGYDEARKVYNGMHDQRPARVVRPVDRDDVVAALRLAREAGGDVSVRGGGHSAPGFGTNDGGTVIDLSLLKDVQVDPRARTARAGGGCTWGIFNDATHAHGLATTGGVVSTTGIGGLTLGGGIGYLARSAGLSIDNLLSAEVVTADGAVLRASERENEDLFWALRGGGGNFGIATELEYRLHPVPDVLVGIFVFPLEQTRALFQFYREFIRTAPEQLGAFPAVLIAPPLPFLPESAHGTKKCAVVACWAGPLDQGEAAMAPIRQVSATVGEMVAPMPYPAINSLFDALLPPGMLQYWKGTFSKDLTDGAIDAHVEHGAGVPTVNTAIHVYPINGAVSRVAPDATAFPYRDATFATVVATVWSDPADTERNIAWTRAYYQALAPHGEPGTYINFMDGDEGARVKDSYRGIYDRLVAVKRKYDPENVFHRNQNIKP
jgi:FAD/FMN-containing dehydrogenase